MCCAVFSDYLLKHLVVNMYPDSGQCHPFGRSVMRRETGKNPPNTKKNFGYLM
ncbi:traU family protein, partial [Escherichia coli]